MSRRLLDGVDATGAGSSVSIVRNMVRVARDHTVSIIWTDTSGSITAMVIDLEGSINGSDFHVLATHTLTSAERTAKKAMFHVKEMAVSYVRANITTLTETGTHVIDVDYESFDPK